MLESPGNRVQGFLGPGHVCTVMGQSEYEPIARDFRVPIVITGFEPLDLLEGVLLAVRQLEEGRAEVENQYARAVRPEGNPQSQRLIDGRVRGLRPQVAGNRPDPQERPATEPGLPRPRRRAAVRRGRHHDGRIDDLHQRADPQGLKKPHDCPAFGRECTPQTPLGATMVSSEGACAAYYAYGRHLEAAGKA